MTNCLITHMNRLDIPEFLAHTLSRDTPVCGKEQDARRKPTGTTGVAANHSDGAEARVQSAVLTLGRQIAREQFWQPQAANDNQPTDETQGPQTRQD